MRVDYAFIAEAADARDGLFYVVRGGTDIWFVPPEAEFPIGVGPMSFVVRLSGEPHEVGPQITLKAVIVDADGHTIGFENEGSISLPPHPVDRTRTGSALVHFRLAFGVPSHGAFFFELLHEGERLTQVPFWVVPAPHPSGGSAPHL